MLITVVMRENDYRAEYDNEPQNILRLAICEYLNDNYPGLRF